METTCKVLVFIQSGYFGKKEWGKWQEGYLLNQIIGSISDLQVPIVFV